MRVHNARTVASQGTHAGIRPLERLHERIPAVPGALRRIAGVASLFKAALGRPGPTWDPANRADITNKIYIAALQEEIEELRDRLDGIEDKVAVVHAAELNWRAKMPLRDSVVFTNDAGDVTKLPLEFVLAYSARAQLDASDVVADGDDIVVLDGKRVLARMPKTLFVVLDRVLAQAEWLRVEG